ncbi:MAG: ABC transporter permease [Paludibacteraceae bacterium]|jgi:putative ABC transport system permease protein|nr:ABC transporter permease [Paludibacteraceae bacterium]MDD6357646.1 ABC transporter permease [Bacteroidales bacterium]
MGNIGNLFKIALRALLNNKTRSMLTMFGIIIGVASVITMLAIGEGSKQSIQSSIESMGSNMITIFPSNGQMGGVRQSGSSMQTLKLEDYEALKKDCRHISDISPLVNSSGQAIYGSNNAPTSIYGVTADYLNVTKYKLKSGKLFSEKDVLRNAKVCVIGQTVVENLFSENENPIGKYIRFKNIPFQVVGILEEKGEGSMGNDQDDIVFAPYTSVQKRILAITHINRIVVSAKSDSETDAAIAEITEILRQRHNIQGIDPNDFNVRSQKEMLTMMSSTMNTLTILLACVASISLFIGGVGIMNIMYVSVTERTKEIGLRMSIGARGRDIMMQFLIESILMCITGGLIGIMLGFGATALLQYFSGWPTYITTSSVLLSFAVCTITGVFFGWSPARKAAGLDPIEALRYE